ncbi:MAG TPA: nucleotidyltransferase domain-containing protein [Phycisphaerae bacterium]|nr:nucleotidyltransferase domain-containing protein [Phycisphaerae bacterium]HNU44174.1 nucleotidyltransferase domain-containing protein [Phycisphaerae bacterium]
MQGDDLLKKALTLLFDALPPGSQVILFGSRARGEARPDGDFDFLVVEQQVQDRFAEMVRLSALLGAALIPADVVVVSRASFERWRDEPNTLAGRVAKEGRVYESAA